MNKVIGFLLGLFVGLAVLPFVVYHQALTHFIESESPDMPEFVKKGALTSATVAMLVFFCACYSGFIHLLLMFLRSL